MSQIILVDENSLVSDLLTVNLSRIFRANVIHRKNAKDAINLLALLPDVDIIITKDKVEDEDAANIINNYLMKNKMENALIIMGDTRLQIENASAYIFPDQIDYFNWKEIIRIAARHFGILDNLEDLLEKNLTVDYVPINAKIFLNLDRTNCEVFIRIKISNKIYQYVKRLQEGDFFSKEQIEKYMSQGLTHFYINKDDEKKFCIFVSNCIVEKLELKDTSNIEKIHLMGNAYDFVINEILKYGFQSETIQLTESVINNMLSNFQHNPNMASLLHKIINSKTSILYQRGHMTSAVALEIIKNLKISTSQNQTILTYAAFFCDIVLADADSSLNISSYETLEAADLTHAQKNAVLHHGDESARLVLRCSEIPSEVASLIMHHHGASDGIGFSNSISEYSDLIKIFIVAHHFVISLMEYRDNGGSPRPITQELHKRFSSPDVTVIIKALENTLKKRPS